MLAASRLNPDAAQIHLGLGLTLSQLQQPEAAIGEFQRVLKDAPELIPALDGIAKQLIAEQNIRPLSPPCSTPRPITDCS